MPLAEQMSFLAEAARNQLKLEEKTKREQEALDALKQKDNEKAATAQEVKDWMESALRDITSEAAKGTRLRQSVSRGALTLLFK